MNISSRRGIKSSAALALVVAFLACVMAGCAARSEESASEQSAYVATSPSGFAQDYPAQPVVLPSPTPTPTPQPWIRVTYGKPFGSRDTTYQSWVRRSSKLPSLVKWANATFPRPGTDPLNIYIGECSGHTADYGPGNVIRICNGFVYQANDQYHDYYRIDYQHANELTEGLIYFTFLHELAHAIEANYGIPVLGGREASADEFAALAIGDHADMYQPAIAFIKWMWIQRLKGNESQQVQSAFVWDDHPFDTERASQIACFLFAASPTNFAFLQAQYGLIGEAEEQCRDNYAAALHSWRTVLADPRYDVKALISARSTELFAQLSPPPPLVLP